MVATEFQLCLRRHRLAAATGLAQEWVGRRRDVDQALAQDWVLDTEWVRDQALVQALEQVVDLAQVPGQDLAREPVLVQQELDQVLELAPDPALS